MWNISYILSDVSERTGLSIEEIQKTPWGDLEEKMGIKKITYLKSRNGYFIPPELREDQVLTKERFDEDEVKCLKFIKSFSNK